MATIINDKNDLFVPHSVISTLVKSEQTKVSFLVAATWPGVDIAMYGPRKFNVYLQIHTDRGMHIYCFAIHHLHMEDLPYKRFSNEIELSEKFLNDDYQRSKRDRLSLEALLAHNLASLRVFHIGEHLIARMMFAGSRFPIFAPFDADIPMPDYIMPLQAELTRGFEVIDDIPDIMQLTVEEAMLCVYLDTEKSVG